MLCLNISDIAIITFKGVHYCCIIHDISQSAAIYLLGNSVLDDRGYISNTYQKINIKNQVNYHCEDLIKPNNKLIDKKNKLIDKKSYKDLAIYLTRYHLDKSIVMLNLYYDKLIRRMKEKILDS